MKTKIKEFLKNLGLDDLIFLQEKASTEIEERNLKEYQNKRYKNFCISLYKDGRGYPQWRAQFYKKGKRKMLHLGKNPKNYRDSIDNFFEENPDFKELLQE